MGTKEKAGFLLIAGGLSVYGVDSWKSWSLQRRLMSQEIKALQGEPYNRELVRDIHRELKKRGEEPITRFGDDNDFPTGGTGGERFSVVNGGRSPSEGSAFSGLEEHLPILLACGLGAMVICVAALRPRSAAVAG